MYMYKIQWAIHNPKDACKLVDLLWARSFDKIIFRCENNKITDSYNWFISFPSWLAEKETKKYIRNAFKKYAEWCEFIRK